MQSIPPSEEKDGRLIVLMVSAADSSPPSANTDDLVGPARTHAAQAQACEARAGSVRAPEPSSALSGCD